LRKSGLLWPWGSREIAAKLGGEALAREKWAVVLLTTVVNGLIFAGIAGDDDHDDDHHVRPHGLFPRLKNTELGAIGPWWPPSCTAFCVSRVSAYTINFSLPFFLFSFHLSFACPYQPSFITIGG
jgi:hypothetical protein